MFNKTKAWRLAFHPVLFGTYPALALYAINYEQAPVYTIKSSFSFSAILIVSIFALSHLSILLWKSISSWQTFAKVTVMTGIIGTSYYGIYTFFQNLSLQGLARHRFLLPTWMVVFIVLAIIIIKPQSVLKNLINLENLERAAAFTSVILVLFFSYGHISGMMSEGGGFFRVMEIHQKLMFLWGILLLTGILVMARIKNIKIFTEGANVTSSVLCIMALSQIIFLTIQHSNARAADLTIPLNLSPSSINDPDVYYILLDAYSRDDLLRETINYDNSGFVDKMKAIGFVFPPCTRSNYHTTLPSLTSTLNMNYLDKLTPDQRNLPNYYDYVPYLQHNLVRKIFEKRGYETYTFKGRFPFMNIPDSSHYYDLFSDDSGSPQIESQNFYFLFLQTTALRPVLDYFDHYKAAMNKIPPFFKNLIPTKDVFSNRSYKQYQQTMYYLEVLELIPDMPGKKFVYAHLYVTHDPYVFTTDGEFRWSEASDVEGYHDQIIFINSRLLQILQNIIAKSKTPPVIIVQGDHGWVWDERRNRILNAYYLPDGGDEMLYTGITPVNTFRIIMNKYFDGNYELLPDISYYADFKDEVTDDLKINTEICTDK